MDMTSLPGQELYPLRLDLCTAGDSAECVICVVLRERDRDREKRTRERPPGQAYVYIYIDGDNGLERPPPKMSNRLRLLCVSRDSEACKLAVRPTSTRWAVGQRMVR